MVIGMEKYISLLRQGNYKEAYKGFKEIYKNNKSIIALYYLTMIDYQFNNVELQTLLDNFIILYIKGTKQIKKAIVSPYLSLLLLEIEDYKSCYEIANKEVLKGSKDYLILLSYAKGLFYYKKDSSQKVINLVEEVLKTEGLKDKMKLYIYDFLVRVYLEKDDIHKAKHILGKLSLIYPNNPRLAYIALVINIHENDLELDADFLEQVYASEYKLNFLNELTEYYYQNKKYDLAIEYLEEMERTFSSYYTRRKIAICYLENKEYQKVIDLLEKENNMIADCAWLISEGYYFIGTKEALIKAKDYCQKAYELEPEVKYLKCLGDIYYEIKDLDSLNKIIELLETKYHDKYAIYLKVYYYIYQQEFDKAEKECKKLFKVMKISDQDKFDLAFKCFKNINKANKLAKKFVLDKQNHFLRLISAYYGEHNQPINQEIVDIETEALLKKDDKSNCELSLLGWVLLEKNLDMALELIKEGVERYLKDLDRCSCSIGVYSYLLLHGINVERDVDKAYELCKLAIEKSIGNGNENVGNIFAEASIILNKDLEKVYSFLLETRDRRYDISRLFMIIKVGKLLDKDVSFYQKQYKKALKNVSIKEKNYYLNNPEFVTINNY